MSRQIQNYYKMYEFISMCVFEEGKIIVCGNQQHVF